MKRSIMIAAVAAVALTAGNAVANDQKNGVQVAWGSGQYFANYERMISGNSGVLGEVTLYTGENASGFGIGAGYRWHWSEEKGLGSGFLGVISKYSQTTGDDADLTVISVIPHIGKRWIIGPGISVVGRAGYGYANTNFDWAGDDTAVDTAVESILNFLFSFDAELSIGYSF